MAGSKKENIGLIATKCRRLVKYLEAKNNILLLTTSTRYEEHPWDIPKTTQLALRIKNHLKQKGKHVTVLDVAKLRIHTCEGNISAERGNNCGVLEAKLPDKGKNPRASIGAGPRSTTRMTNSIRSAANYSNRKRWSFSSPSDGDKRTACINASSNALAGSRTEYPRLAKSRYLS